MCTAEHTLTYIVHTNVLFEREWINNLSNVEPIEKYYNYKSQYIHNLASNLNTCTRTLLFQTKRNAREPDDDLWTRSYSNFETCSDVASILLVIGDKRESRTFDRGDNLAEKWPRETCKSGSCHRRVVVKRSRWSPESDEANWSVRNPGSCRANHYYQCSHAVLLLLWLSRSTTR